MKLFAPALIVAAGSIIGMAAAQQPGGGGSDGPRYIQDNRMLRPDNYREWVWLSSGLGMSYAPGPAGQNPDFDNVFVNPSAYRSFVATGRWPDKTVLVLETRSSLSKTSINQSGGVQGDVTGMEVHVRDQARFPDKWAFFAFGRSGQTGNLIPKQANCYSCHEQHGAVDTTFVQFYPTLMDIANRKGTARQQY